MPARPPLRPFLFAMLLALAIAPTVPSQAPAWASRDVVPTARIRHAMAFDSARGRTVLFGGAFTTGALQDTWEWDGIGWIRCTTTTSPLLSVGQTMAFDPRRGVTVLVTRGQTWEWNGTAWRLVVTTGAPPDFEDCSVVYHAGTNPGILLFGGLRTSQTPFTFMRETWQFDGVSWARRSTTGPSGRRSMAMAYSPATGRTYLLGGDGDTGTLSDSWAWNGIEWALVSSVGIPGPLTMHTMTWDQRRNQLVVVGGWNGVGNVSTWFGTVGAALSVSWSVVSNFNANLNRLVPPARRDTATVYDSVRGCQVTFGGWEYLGSASVGFNDKLYELQAGSTWRERPAQLASPSPRSYLGMAFDKARSAPVLFGGWNGAALGDTWTMTNATWTNRGLSAISPRRQAALTFMSAAGTTLLFGGTDGSSYFGDSFVWDGTFWALVLQLASPSPRSGHVMVYDERRARVVLFGGYGVGGALGDTWEFDPTAWQNPWTRITTNGAPPARSSHRMAYDAARGVIVLFGGADSNGQFLGDTWVYHGPTRTWSQHQSTNAPPRRWEHAMEYDPGRGVVVLCGGYGNPQCGNYCASHLDDVWEFDTVDWHPRTAGLLPAHPNPIRSTGPTGREGAGLVYDTNLHRLVLFGGAGNNQYRADTWLYGASVDRFADAQVGGGILLRCTYPVAGSTATISFPSPSSMGWLSLQVGAAPHETMVIPAGLACGTAAKVFGYNAVLIALNGNPAELQFTLPAWALGVPLCLQGIAYDVTNSCLRFSDPLAVTVQSF